MLAKPCKSFYSLTLADFSSLLSFLPVKLQTRLTHSFKNIPQFYAYMAPFACNTTPQTPTLSLENMDVFQIFTFILSSWKSSLTPRLRVRDPLCPPISHAHGTTLCCRLLETGPRLVHLVSQEGPSTGPGAERPTLGVCRTSK